MAEPDLNPGSLTSYGTWHFTFFVSASSPHVHIDSTKAGFGTVFPLQIYLQYLDQYLADRDQ